MRHQLLFFLAVLALSTGCRTTEPNYEATSLTRFSQSGVALTREREPAAAATNSAPSPATTAVHPVVYQVDRTEPTPAEAPRAKPEPQEESLPLSDLKLLDFEGIALQNSPVLSEAASRIEAARGTWVQSGLPPNPVLGYSGQQLGSGGQAEQQGVFVGQEFITGQKLRLNRQVAAWEIQRLESEFEALRLRVLTDVRIGYYDVLVAQRRRELAGELVRIGEQGVTAAQALFKSDEVSEADPLRARVDVDTSRILLQNARNEHFGAWRRLTAILGIPVMALERIEGELKPDDLDVTWQTELQRILTESPELAAAITEVEAARWAVERAYAEVVPNIDVQAVIQDDRGTGSRNANLQVSLPIPIWNRNQGGIRRAESEVAAASQAVDRLALDLQARLATAFQRYENARNQVEQYSRDGGIIANSRRILDLIRAGYQAEEFGVLDLLTAQRTYFQTNLAYLDALRELSASVMEIRGFLLSDSLPR